MAIYVPERKVWTRQPPFFEGLRIADKWMARNPAHIIMNGYDFVTRTALTLNNGVKTSTADGYGTLVTSTSNIAPSIPSQLLKASNGAGPFTIAVLCRKTTSAKSMLASLARPTEVSTNREVYICANTKDSSLVYQSGTFMCINQSTSDTFKITNAIGNGLSFFSWSRIDSNSSPVCRIQANTTFLQATGTSYEGLPIWTSEHSLYAGSWSGAGWGTTEMVPLLAAFNTALTDAELLSLNENPWQLFAPRRQWFALGAAASGIDLSADAQSSATATGVVNQTITLAGASVALATATGVVNQTISIAGSAASISVANGVATITTTLAGDAFNQAFASGLINQAVALDSAANAQSTATGSMGLSVTLSGDALAQVIASASFDGALTALSATAQSSATATGALIAEIALAGDAEIIVTGSAGLTHTQTLTGAGAVVASGSGNLSLNAVGLSGNAIAQVLAGGSIQFVTQIEANALAQVTAQMINTGVFASDRKIEKWTMRPSRNYALIAPSRNYTLAAVA